MKLNTTHDVFRALADGRKVRKTGWDPSQFVHIGNTGTIITEHGDSFALCFNKNSEWELFEEPKKMKQVWQWRYKHRAHLYWNVCGILAASAEEALKYVTDNSDNWEIEQHSGPYEVPE